MAKKTSNKSLTVKDSFAFKYRPILILLENVKNNYHEKALELAIPREMHLKF